MPSADPLAGTAVCRDRRRAPSPRYRNEAGEGSSSLAFATARREVLSGFPYASSRALHRADLPLLSKWVSGPSCASRRLFRRHHLRLQRDLAGRRRTPLLGFPKIAPPSCTARESTPTATSSSEDEPCPKADTTRKPDHPKAILPESSRRSFGIDGATANPRSVSAVLHRPDGLRLSNPARVLQRAADPGVRDVLKRPAKPSPHRAFPPFEVFSPSPAAWRHLRGTSRVERHQDRLSPGLFTADLAPSPFPTHPPLHR